MQIKQAMEKVSHKESNYVTNFKEDLFKEELVEKYIFVSTPILIKMTFSGCRCAAFYD